MHPGFREDVLREQATPTAHCFEETSHSEKPRSPRNRKYHFRTEEAKKRMSAIGKANNYHILRAKQAHLDRAQDPSTIRQEPCTRETYYNKLKNSKS